LGAAVGAIALGLSSSPWLRPAVANSTANPKDNSTANPTVNSPAVLPAAPPSTLRVERFEVRGSTVFTEAEWNPVLAPFTGRTLSLAELLQARTALTNLYLERGYITSGAFLPNQDFRPGEPVILQVLEGRLAEIQVVGAQRLDPNYVRSRLALAGGPPLNRDRLLTALQLLQLNPLIQTINAELAAGVEPGTNRLVVAIAEAPSTLTLDNRRSPSVGTDRRQLELEERNFLGGGDSLRLAYTNTEGSNAYEVIYTLPINPQDGTLAVNFSTSNSRVIEAPFTPLDIVAAARSYELTWRQPLVRQPEQEVALGLTFSHRQSETELLATPFPLSPGADAEGRTWVSALRFFQEFSQRGPQTVWGARSQFGLGLEVLGANVFAEGPDSRFLTWRGQLQYANVLAPDALLLVRGDIQLADRPLVPIEQIGLGGRETVRGYRQDLLLTDNGFNASAEVRWPVLRVPESQGILQVVPFLDYGTGWNAGGEPPALNSLWGTGLGLRWQQGDRLTARLEYGIPLAPTPADRRTLQEQGWYFSLQWQLF